MAIIQKINAAKKRGFTLIELMIVVVIIGVLAAMAIYGVNKYVANAKTAEGRTVLGRISKDAVKAAEGEAVSQGVLPLNGTAAITRRLCGAATADAGVPAGATYSMTAPAAPSQVQGKKFQADATLYRNSGDGNTGFRCLGTEVIGPTYYAFGYTANVDGTIPLAATQTFTAWAVGDLDGDTNASALWIDGAVLLGTSNNLTIALNPTVGEFAPEE